MLKRLAIAKDEFAVGPTCHVSNGDEQNVPLYAGNYHKSLPHDRFGQVGNAPEICARKDRKWVRAWALYTAE